MKTRLSGRETLFIGAMLFGLFFGAGNLIFPIYLGQQAGHQVGWAIVGLLITGIGLPLLGVMGIGLTRSNGVFDLATKVSRPYAYGFTIMLYFTLGPLFAMPRLATTAFQIGLTPFISSAQQPMVLLLFSLLFFGVTWWLARNPGKLMTYVGKWLTPIFLILLGSLLVVALIKPLGGLHGTAHGAYATAPLLTGFTEGYNTMDALASLAFGIVVVDAIKGLGVKEPAQIAKDTIKAGIISVSLMGLIYALLAIVGTMSRGQLPLASNGGITLAQIAKTYFGAFGNLLLALIVIIACLKTAVGLTSAFGDTLHEMMPKLPYQGLIVVACVIPAVLANVGLTQLIAYSTPVLMTLYPLAIVLILLASLSPWLGTSRWLFAMTTAWTMIPALLAGVAAMPSAWTQAAWLQTLQHLNNQLPLASLGLGWTIPALFGLMFGFIGQTWARHRMH
ncbi:branched-chain amino acid transport system II carrier protein [Lactiplantibacillus mudanjiangensis]|uniref:Branched-chain amino acid transport system carrier protein n=1 Tax=Lactiplantibacillus mudanjiangensis TaxID=1296538 RepID=A0A660E1P3_9LACO|nr:branched-chain amino acid transport system II carrier protein [Lactiplantibacillus mudanjiangensis]VDG20782.1 branched-chain amino acid transport system II carrier protein [Lactobacillus pentosus] [Lactiplantibacillus mudanjiangensis]VDG24475.1 branched-chain amino acid transport system II carrier protein [Lactobacillus pentosus] [Lactiplantibacillus mudanjiangensis]VDG30053.1 branched-chain amino acid transport system II carrier protein [Lactobacillus pentosus] [Lactiplantibacillus mudanjian